MKVICISDAFKKGAKEYNLPLVPSIGDECIVKETFYDDDIGAYYYDLEYYSANGVLFLTEHFVEIDETDVEIKSEIQEPELV